MSMALPAINDPTVLFSVAHRFFAKKTSILTFAGFKDERVQVTIFPPVLKRRSEGALVADTQRYLVPPSTKPRDHLLHRWQESSGNCLPLPLRHLQVLRAKKERLRWSWKNCQETSSPFPPMAVHFEVSEQFQYETSSPIRWKKQPLVFELDFTERLYFCEILNYHLPDDMYVVLSLPSLSSVGSW